MRQQRNVSQNRETMLKPETSTEEDRKNKGKTIVETLVATKGFISGSSVPRKVFVDQKKNAVAGDILSKFVITCVTIEVASVPIIFLYLKNLCGIAMKKKRRILELTFKTYSVIFQFKTKHHYDHTSRFLRVLLEERDVTKTVTENLTFDGFGGGDEEDEDLDEDEEDFQRRYSCDIERRVTIRERPLEISSKNGDINDEDINSLQNGKGKSKGKSKRSKGSISNGKSRKTSRKGGIFGFLLGNMGFSDVENGPSSASDRERGGDNSGGGLSPKGFIMSRRLDRVVFDDWTDVQCILWLKIVPFQEDGKKAIGSLYQKIEKLGEEELDWRKNKIESEIEEKIEELKDSAEEGQDLSEEIRTLEQRVETIRAYDYMSELKKYFKQQHNLRDLKNLIERIERTIDDKIEKFIHSHEQVEGVDDFCRQKESKINLVPKPKSKEGENQGSPSGFGESFREFSTRVLSEGSSFDSTASSGGFFGTARKVCLDFCEDEDAEPGEDCHIIVRRLFILYPMVRSCVSSHISMIDYRDGKMNSNYFHTLHKIVNREKSQLEKLEREYNIAESGYDISEFFPFLEHFEYRSEKKKGTRVSLRKIENAMRYETKYRILWDTNECCSYLMYSLVSFKISFTINQFQLFHCPSDEFCGEFEKYYDRILKHENGKEVDKKRRKLEKKRKSLQNRKKKMKKTSSSSNSEKDVSLQRERETEEEVEEEEDTLNFVALNFQKFQKKIGSETGFCVRDLSYLFYLYSLKYELETQYHTSYHTDFLPLKKKLCRCREKFHKSVKEIDERVKEMQELKLNYTMQMVPDEEDENAVLPTGEKIEFLDRQCGLIDEMLGKKETQKQKIRADFGKKMRRFVLKYQRNKTKLKFLKIQISHLRSLIESRVDLREEKKRGKRSPFHFLYRTVEKNNLERKREIDEFLNCPSIREYFNCKTYVVKDGFFFSRRRKNLLKKILKKRISNLTNRRVPMKVIPSPMDGVGRSVLGFQGGMKKEKKVVEERTQEDEMAICDNEKMMDFTIKLVLATNGSAFLPEGRKKNGENVSNTKDGKKMFDEKKENEDEETEVGKNPFSLLKNKTMSGTKDSNMNNMQKNSAAAKLVSGESKKGLLTRKFLVDIVDKCFRPDFFEYGFFHSSILIKNVQIHFLSDSFIHIENISSPEYSFVSKFIRRTKRKRKRELEKRRRRRKKKKKLKKKKNMRKRKKKKKKKKRRKKKKKKTKKKDEEDIIEVEGEEKEKSEEEEEEEEEESEESESDSEEDSEDKESESEESKTSEEEEDYVDSAEEEEEEDYVEILKKRDRDGVLNQYFDFYCVDTCCPLICTWNSLYKRIYKLSKQVVHVNSHCKWVPYSLNYITPKKTQIPVTPVFEKQSDPFNAALNQQKLRKKQEKEMKRNVIKNEINCQQLCLFFLRALNYTEFHFEAKEYIKSLKTMKIPTLGVLVNENSLCERCHNYQTEYYDYQNEKMRKMRKEAEEVKKRQLKSGKFDHLLHNQQIPQLFLRDKRDIHYEEEEEKRWSSKMLCCAFSDELKRLIYHFRYVVLDWDFYYYFSELFDQLIMDFLLDKEKEMEMEKQRTKEGRESRAGKRKRMKRWKIEINEFSKIRRQKSTSFKIKDQQKKNFHENDIVPHDFGVVHHVLKEESKQKQKDDEVEEEEQVIIVDPLIQKKKKKKRKRKILSKPRYFYFQKLVLFHKPINVLLSNYDRLTNLDSAMKEKLFHLSSYVCGKKSKKLEKVNLVEKARELRKKSRKKKKFGKLYFSTHSQLDHFVRLLNTYKPRKFFERSKDGEKISSKTGSSYAEQDWIFQFPGMYDHLKSLDRSFWLRKFKNLEKYALDCEPALGGCPFSNPINVYTK